MRRLYAKLISYSLLSSISVKRVEDASDALYKYTVIKNTHTVISSRLQTPESRTVYDPCHGIRDALPTHDTLQAHWRGVQLYSAGAHQASQIAGKFLGGRILRDSEIYFSGNLFTSFYIHPEREVVISISEETNKSFAMYCQGQGQGRQAPWNKFCFKTEGSLLRQRGVY